MHEHSSPPCLIREHGMPVVQLLSSNASDPVDARLQTFGDIIDVDVSAVGRWLRHCARRSGCATCINCAAKFTPTRRYTRNSVTEERHQRSGLARRVVLSLQNSYPTEHTSKNVIERSTPHARAPYGHVYSGLTRHHLPSMLLLLHRVSMTPAGQTLFMRSPVPLGTHGYIISALRGPS